MEIQVPMASIVAYGGISIMNNSDKIIKAIRKINPNARDFMLMQNDIRSISLGTDDNTYL